MGTAGGAAPLDRADAPREEFEALRRRRTENHSLLNRLKIAGVARGGRAERLAWPLTEMSVVGVDGGWPGTPSRGVLPSGPL